MVLQMMPCMISSAPPPMETRRHRDRLGTQCCPTYTPSRPNIAGGCNLTSDPVDRISVFRHEASWVHLPIDVLLTRLINHRAEGLNLFGHAEVDNLVID